MVAPIKSVQQPQLSTIADDSGRGTACSAPRSAARASAHRNESRLTAGAQHLVAVVSFHTQRRPGQQANKRARP